MRTTLKSVILRFFAWLPAAVLFPAASQAAEVPALMLGSAWYPEHSTDAQVEADLAMMEKAGLRMARVAEFAWSSLEPEEGYYTLDWLDKVITAAAAHKICIVIGTPSDAPPIWLTRKYPEILRVDIEGRRSRPGAGRSFSYASPKYRELCRRIVEQLAQRFGHNPNVIGWQIGNEPTEDSYDAAALQDFRDWLRTKYGTIDKLNERWMTWYWSHTYDSFDDIILHHGGAPGHALDYKRFVSSEWRSFQRVQIDAIRKYADRRQFITTNFGGLGWADRVSRQELAKDLDLVSWDNYVGIEHFDPARNGATYSTLEQFDPWRNGATHDLVRGWKQRNFWVMEMQPAFVDWAPVCNALEPGVVRTMVWEAIGHGADGILFWEWRAARGSYGQYHGVLVGPDTTPAPVYAEVQRAAGELAKAVSVLADTTPPQSQVAILHDYDSRWAIDHHRQTQRYDQIEVLLGYYRVLRERTQSVDIIDPSYDLSCYKLVVAPSLNVISQELGERFKDYVNKGGHLLLGPRSGMMDEYCAMHFEHQPGLLVAALGGRVEQFYALTDDVPVSGKWGNGRATIWAEHLSATAPDTEIVLRYGAGNGWLEGQPAAIQRKLGKGTISYLGAILDLPLMRSAATMLIGAAQVDPAPISAPDTVEVCRRVGAGRDVFVLINHAKMTTNVRLPGPMMDVLTGAEVRNVELPPREVAILVRASVGP
jgi:beta-galactosidase